MSRDRALTDAQWALIEPLLPSSKGKASRLFRDHRQVEEGILFRYRTGCPWRDLPSGFGPWQTVWKRHARFSKDGTWDRVLQALLVRPTMPASWTGSCRSIRRSAGCISTA
jgi:transposase